MESGYWIMERYIELLISMKLYTLVPFYASRLLPERRDHLLVTFMYCKFLGFTFFAAVMIYFFLNLFRV